jgi:hypothetical protein
VRPVQKKVIDSRHEPHVLNSLIGMLMLRSFRNMVIHM